MHTRSIRRSSDNGWAEQGGYMQAKKNKLEHQFRPDEATIQSNIFQGISIYVNGYTDPPALELRDLIRAHGGQYRSFYSRSKVTHIIASRLPTGKVKKLTDQKIVTSKWILESITARRLLPWQQFQLYPERMGGVGQRQIRVVPAVSDDAGTLAVSVADCSKPQESNDFLGEHPDDLPSVDLETSAHTRSPDDKTGRRLQQMRLDACLSPPKPSTSCVPHSKSTGPISLKQLLKGSLPGISTSEPNEKPIGSRLPEYQPSRSPPEPPSDTDAQLATFYARSRLHHLSSWANELRELVQQLRDDPAHRDSSLGEEWKQSVIGQGDPDTIITLHARQTRASTKHSPKHRVYFHIDMDCFFVSVSLRNRPELKDKPVAITHANSSSDDPKVITHRRSGVHSMSEVASCSYAARRMGIRNGMLLGQARQLCPDLITLPYDFEAYKKVSELLYRTVSEFTLNIQAVSCDELYADCTDLLLLDYPEPEKAHLSDSDCIVTQRIINPLVFGKHLRSLVQERSGGCTASIGFGSSKLLARLATKKAKPNGQAWLFGASADHEPDSAWRWSMGGLLSATSTSSFPSCDCELTGADAEWLCNLPLQELPGVGRVLVTRLATAFNVTTCGELMRHVTRNQLIDLIGQKTGERIYWLCRGRDPCDNKLLVQKPSKSVSACMNYGIRLQTSADLVKLVRSLTNELVSRMSTTRLTHDGASGRGGIKGRNLTVRVFIRAPNAPQESAKFMGHGICNKASRMVSLPEPTADPDVIQRFAMSVLRQLCPNVKDLRGLGLQINRLSMVTGDRCVNKAPKQLTPVKPLICSKTSLDSVLTVNGSSFKPVLSPEASKPEDQTVELFHTPVRVRRRSLRLKRRASSSRLSNSTPSCSTSVDVFSPLTIDTALDSNNVSPSSGGTFHSPILLNSPSPAIELSSNQHAARNIRSPVLPSSTPLPQNRGPHRMRSDHSVERSRPAPKSISPIKLTASPSPGPLTQTSSDATDLFANKTMDQLQHIFANWIISEPCPQLEDICILGSYLVSLVPVNLERLRLCLIRLDRLITELGPPDARCDWRMAYSRILMTVDYAVQQCYGTAKLSLRPG